MYKEKTKFKKETLEILGSLSKIFDEYEFMENFIKKYNLEEEFKKYKERIMCKF